MTKYYRATPEAYPQLAFQIDNQPVFKSEWIDSGCCEHIIPPSLPTQEDGYVYGTIPAWFLTRHPEKIAPFLAQVEEVTEEEYQAALEYVKTLNLSVLIAVLTGYVDLNVDQLIYDLESRSDLDPIDIDALTVILADYDIDINALSGVNLFS